MTAQPATDTPARLTGHALRVAQFGVMARINAEVPADWPYIHWSVMDVVTAHIVAAGDFPPAREVCEHLADRFNLSVDQPWRDDQYNVTHHQWSGTIAGLRVQVASVESHR
jgi:hypothetical protein